MIIVIIVVDWQILWVLVMVLVEIVLIVVLVVVVVVILFVVFFLVLFLVLFFCVRVAVPVLPWLDQLQVQQRQWRTNASSRSTSSTYVRRDRLHWLSRRRCREGVNTI